MILVEVTENMEILKILTQDKDFIIRKRILDKEKMRNEELPTEILEILANDEDNTIKLISREILKDRKESSYN